MSLFVLVQWAEKMLDIQSGLPQPERQEYSFVKGHVGIINELSTALSMVRELLIIFKTKGLSYTKIANCTSTCNDYKQKAIGSKSSLINKIKTYLLAEKAALPNDAAR